MAKKIYVGNLSFNTVDETLKNLFSKFGEVESVSIITDKATGSSKGFGFVELADDSDAEGAIRSLNQKEVDGRKIRVNFAEDKKRR